jgi:ribose 5-phosphate isomerase B
MRIAIGSDGRSAKAREQVESHLRQAGHEAIPCGPTDGERVDYPEVAFAAAQAVVAADCEFGVLVGKTGIGMTISANKVPGIRAALCHDEISAEMARRCNDAQVLCVSGELTGPESTCRIVDVFLRTPFEGGHHERRVSKISELERGQGAV